MQTKVKQMMLIRRQMMVTKDNNGSKWSKEQIWEDIEKIRKRLVNIDAQKNKDKFKRKNTVIFKNAYGKNHEPI